MKAESVLVRRWRKNNKERFWSFPRSDVIYVVSQEPKIYHQDSQSISILL